MASSSVRGSVMLFAALAAWSALMICPSSLAAQGVPQTAVAIAERDARNVTHVNVDAVDKPLVDVLLGIATQAKLKPAYNTSLIPSRRVTMHLQHVPIDAAFQEALRGTGFAAQIQPTGLVLIVRDGVVASNGAVSGRVTDAKTKAALKHVTVILDDSAALVRTNDNGQYHFASVSAGRHRLMVRQIGYARQSAPVTVVDDQTATVDFALESSSHTLDQVVVTATGEQRYRELGHVVTKLNADSLVKTAPITTLSELLTARVPGLQVLTSGGIVGGEVGLRLRGQTTTSLDPQPIVIVDGVRYKNTNTVQDESGTLREDVRPFGAEERSPLNDLNVHDIETIEVVKGPSASTLYGPDAANGVILITTKRGKSGKPEWHVYAHPSLRSSVPETRLARGYQAWGHDPITGLTVPYNCTVLNQYYDHSCILDSITVAKSSPNDADLTVLSPNRLQGQIGASVSGGSEALQYFVSGNYSSQLGVLTIPARTVQVLKQQQSTASFNSALKNPNTQETIDLHSNLSTNISKMGTVRLTTTYTQSSQRGINVGVFSSAYSSLRIPAGVAGADSVQFLDQRAYPDAFIQTSLMQGRRVEGVLSGDFRPIDWLALNASLGTDIGSSTDVGVAPRGSTSAGFGGQIGDYRRNNIGRTASAGATATAKPNWLSFRSSAGVQYIYTHLDGLNADGYNLAPASTSINSATLLQTSQLWSESVTLGTYGEEVVGFNDRLFVTGSLRVDGSTSYGEAYHPRPYPKIGLSWIASDEPFLRHLPGVDELRFRYSYGSASRAPTSAMKIGQIQSYQSVIEGSNQNVYQRVLLANPVLRPERTREAEYGADVTLFSGVVQTSITGYKRRTDDQLQVLQFPNGFPGAQWGNVGDVSASGVEASVTATIIKRRALGLDLNFSYNYQTNKLVSLGTGQASFSQYGGYQVGRPLGSVFARGVVAVHDTVGGGPDGIVFPEEVELSPNNQYRGVLYPPHTYTLTPSATVLGGRVRISTLFDRATGFVQLNPYGGTNCRDNGVCLAPFLKSTPLLEQAQFAVSNFDYEPGDFTRWRELSVNADLPQRLMHFVHLNGAQVTVAVRNLALWSAFHGPDPESQPGAGLLGSGSNVAGASGIPLPRVWSVNFNVTP